MIQCSMTEAADVLPLTPPSDIIHEFALPMRLVSTEIDPLVWNFIEAHGLTKLHQGMDLTALHWYDYHNLDHSLDVEGRAQILHRLVGRYAPHLITPQDTEIIRVAGQGHDLRIKGQLKMEKDMLILAQRAGESEHETAIAIEEYMLECNEKAVTLGFPVAYTELEIQIVKQCVIATIPSFENGQVIQKELSEDTPLPAVLVALSDLSIAMKGVSAFEETSNNLLRERYIGIKMLLMRAHEGEPLTTAEQDLIADTICSWTQSQAAFLEGRMIRLPHDVDLIRNEVAREAVLAHLMYAHQKALKHMVNTVWPRRKEIVQVREGNWLPRLLDDCRYPRSLYA